MRKNPPIDTIVWKDRKDPPEGLLNNPPMDGMAWEDQSEEGVTVSVAAVAAAPNTTAYRAKYGSGHYRPGDNEESSEDYTGENESLSSNDNIDEWEGGKHTSGNNEESSKDNGEGECLSLGFVSSHEDMDGDDYVDIDVNSDSEDEMRSSFPKNSNRLSKLVVDGPQARDTSGMTASQKDAVEREDRIIRKK